MMLYMSLSYIMSFVLYPCIDMYPPRSKKSALASPNPLPFLVSDMLHLFEDSDDHAMPSASKPPGRFGVAIGEIYSGYHGIVTYHRYGDRIEIFGDI